MQAKMLPIEKSLSLHVACEKLMLALSSYVWSASQLLGPLKEIQNGNEVNYSFVNLQL